MNWGMRKRWIDAFHKIWNHILSDRNRKSYMLLYVLYGYGMIDKGCGMRDKLMKWISDIEQNLKSENWNRKSEIIKKPKRSHTSVLFMILNIFENDKLKKKRNVYKKTYTFTFCDSFSLTYSILPFLFPDAPIASKLSYIPRYFR